MKSSIHWTLGHVIKFISMNSGYSLAEMSENIVEAVSNVSVTKCASVLVENGYYGGFTWTPQEDVDGIWLGDCALMNDPRGQDEPCESCVR